ncbi:hypothetical protein D3C74_459600 [compost metagenome]
MYGQPEYEGCAQIRQILSMAVFRFLCVHGAADLPGISSAGIAVSSAGGDRPGYLRRFSD